MQFTHGADSPIGVQFVAATVGWQPARRFSISRKAAVCTRYGPTEAVHVENVGKPVPKDDEVLIEVRAAALHPADWQLKQGKPYIMRFMIGLRGPKDTGLGFDVADVVEAVGRNVTGLSPATRYSGGSTAPLPNMLALPNRQSSASLIT